MSASVPRTICSSPGQLALWTTSMGASSAQPAARSPASTLCSSVIDKKMHSVQWWRASSASDSPSGMGVRPSTRVKITLCVTSGSVKLSTAAAAEAMADDTPGTTRTGTPAASSGCTTSMRAPYSAGSPVCRRITVVCWRACSINHAAICASVMSLLSAMVQPGGAQRVAAALTSDPANRMAPARSIRLRPLTVMSSGSPGPAPTNQTVPVTLRAAKRPRQHPHGEQRCPTPIAPLAHGPEKTGTS